MSPKPWYKSRTLWVNSFAAVLVAVEASMQLIQPHIPVNFYAVVAVVLPVVNAALRVITTSPLALAALQAGE